MAASGRKSEDVLNAALILFEEKTFYGAAMPEIAAKAKVGMGTVYRYFPTKEQLVNDLYRQLRLAFNTAVLGPVVEDRVQQAFYTYWARIVTELVERPRAMRFLELHPHRSYLSADNVRLERQFGAALEHFVVRGQRDGAIKTGSPLILTAIIRGAIAELLRRGSEREPLPEAFLDEAKYSLWDAIATEPNDIE